MIFDGKKAAQQILKGMQKDESPPSGPGPENKDPEGMVDDDFHGLHVASQEMIDAIHNRDPMNFHKALRSYLVQHQDHEPDSASEDDGPGEE